MDSLGALNAFVQAAEVRSFAQWQTSSSSAVFILSNRQGCRTAGGAGSLVRLFHRSTRTITLTPEGSLLP